MRILIGIIAFVVWGGVSIQWYVCGVKQLCNEAVKKESDELVITEQPTDTLINKKELETITFSVSEIAVYFPFAKSYTEISKNLSDSMNVIVADMKNSDAFVFLTGNTDSIGTTESNHKLALERAEWVRQLMVSYGLNAEKIILNSNGESNPIAENSTEAGRAKNRRVDIILKSK